MQKKDIRGLEYYELEKYILDCDLQKYRAKQVYEWLFRRGAANFDDMTNLSVDIKNVLSDRFYITCLECENHKISKDKTEKFLFKLGDGNFIESVLIPSKGRYTLCISTQVGCRYGCVFCESGRYGFTRNLSSAEIVSQFLYIRFKRDAKITNVVYMGMGEPLDNYINVEKSIKILNDKNGINFGARNITVSTSGLVKGIEALKHLGLQINLSISLHAAIQEKRREIMPIARKYSLNELVRASKHYTEFTGRMITLEYILLRGINMTTDDMNALAVIAQDLHAKINLIPYNNTVNTQFVPPREDVQKCVKALAKNSVFATVRDSKGIDIDAACGQLAGKYRRERRSAFPATD